MTRTALARLLVLHGLLGAFLTSAPGIARVTLDGTLGPRASLSGNMLVPASVGRQVGGNLFHSLGTFNIHSGESLYFTPNGSSAPISNVISRVTGGSGSTINGVLGSTIPGANVFLINPAGIVFGPNAQLDVSGSFYASTANYLKLADGGRFDATTPANTSLTVAAPMAFGFLGPAPAGITVSGSVLAVPVGQTLGLIGGDLMLKNAAYVAAFSGTAHLVSGASAGEARLTAGAFDVSSFSTLGRVLASGGSVVDVSEPTGQSAGGGSVYLRGGKFVVDGSSVYARTKMADGGVVDISVSGDIRLANSAPIDTTSFGAGRGGDIAISVAGAVSMTNSAMISNAFGEGDAGNIMISSPNLMMDSSYVSSNTLGSGNAGLVSITANTIKLVNGSQIQSANALSTATGDGGKMNVTAESLAMFGTDTAGFESGLFASTFGSGNAGDIVLNLGRLNIGSGGAISAISAGSGNGGDVQMRVAGTISMDGSRISTSALGSGSAGNIQITATKAISLNNNASIESGASGDGDGGSIQINARHLTLANGAYIENSGAEAPGLGGGGNIAITATGTISMNNASISSAAYGDGDAGNIQISTHDLALANRAFIDSGGAKAPGSGSGGSITIDAAGTVALDGRSTIESIAFGPGGTGSIRIDAIHLALANGSYISTETQSSEPGGNISITAAGSIVLDGASLINSSTFESGDAGDIQVTVGDLLLANRSVISTSSLLGATGQGGNIGVSAGRVLTMFNGAIVAVSTGAGNAGAIVVNAGGRLLLDGSSIATSTRDADGGDINVVAKDLIYLKNSTITSSVQGGDRNGGNIFIDPTFLVLSNSSIIANAFEGAGGNITISAGNLFQSPESVIDASSRLGISGSVVISSPITDLSGGLIALPASYLNTSALLGNQCAARLAGNASSLVLAGRGGLAVEPDGWLSGAGSIGPSTTTTAAVSPPEHRPLFPLLASSRAFGCAR